MNKFLSLIITIVIANNVIAQEIKYMSVKQAIDYAMENNYEIINAGKDVESAGYQVKESTSIGLPQVNASVGYNDNIARPVMIIPDFTDPSKTWNCNLEPNTNASLSASSITDII